MVITDAHTVGASGVGSVEGSATRSRAADGRYGAGWDGVDSGGSLALPSQEEGYDSTALFRHGGMAGGNGVIGHLNYLVLFAVLFAHHVGHGGLQPPLRTWSQFHASGILGTMDLAFVVCGAEAASSSATRLMAIRSAASTAMRSAASTAIT